MHFVIVEDVAFDSVHITPGTIMTLDEFTEAVHACTHLNATAFFLLDDAMAWVEMFYA